MIDSGARQDHTPIVMEIDLRRKRMDYQAVIPEFVVVGYREIASLLLRFTVYHRIRAPEENSSSFSFLRIAS